MNSAQVARRVGTSAASQPREAVVATTDPIHPDGAAELQEHARLRVLTATELEPSGPALHGIDALIVRRPVPAAWLDRCPDLRAMVRHGVGMDFVPVAAAEARGIACTNTPGVNDQTVAEYVIGALLHWERRYGHFHAMTASGAWAERRQAAGLREVSGATLGIVGFGRIGERLAHIARGGFDMAVAAHTRTPARLPAGIRALGLHALFGCCDYIVLCCPLTDATRGLIDATVLAAAQPALVLVNVARGAVVVDAALAAALDAGLLRGAILDVHTEQPLTAASPLFGHPKVLHTPHIAGITARSERATSLAAVRAALRLLEPTDPFAHGATP